VLLFDVVDAAIAFFAAATYRQRAFSEFGQVTPCLTKYGSGKASIPLRIPSGEE
jgi:hypothetical protein